MGAQKRLLKVWGAIFAGAMISVAATVLADDTNTRAGSPFIVAQAGSIGGTIGKQGKSATGGEEAKPDRRAPRQSSRASKADNQNRRTSGLSGAAPRIVIDGQWKWNANCETIGPQAAGFVLNQVSPTSFNGRFVTTGAQLSWGTIVNGTLSGDRLSFDRVGHPLGWREHWKARLIGEGNSTKMEGSTTGEAQCTFTANR
jgi:hypothetical protein